MEGSGSAQTNMDPDPGGPNTYRSYGTRSGTLGATYTVLAVVETNFFRLPGSQLWPQLDPSERSRFVRNIHSYIILHQDRVSSSVPERHKHICKQCCHQDLDPDPK
jgi:hypothetical protein